MALTLVLRMTTCPLLGPQDSDDTTTVLRPRPPWLSPASSGQRRAHSLALKTDDDNMATVTRCHPGSFPLPLPSLILKMMATR
ncbi:hypothetical protein OG21DRAFT_1490674 [Imleria badia]|nr:hypothetical protein OG21DRAFT_1490674 [Imleria badia]